MSGFTERLQTRLIDTRTHLLAAAVFVLSLVGPTLWWILEGTKIQGDAASPAIVCGRLDTPFRWFFSEERFYAGFQLPYCFWTDFLNLSVDSWVAVQILLWGITCLLVFYTAYMLFDIIAAMVAGLSLAVLWEAFRWAIRPQSDLLFIFGVSLAVCAMTRYYITPSRKNWILTIVAWTFMAVTRHFGAVILFSWLVFDLVSSVDTLRNWFNDLFDQMRGRCIFKAYVDVLLLLLLAIYLFSSVQFNLDQGTTFHLYPFWADGIVVTHTTEPMFQYAYTDRGGNSMLTFAARNADHLFILALLKISWFFVPILPRWSMLHIVINIATLVPLTLGFFAGLRVLLVHERRLAGLVVLPVVMILATVGLTWLDGGFNYRAPAMPLFAILTGYWVSASRFFPNSVPPNK